MLEIFGSKKPDQPDRQKKVLDDMPVQSNYAAAVVDAFDRQFGHEASDERREMVQEILKAFSMRRYKTPICTLLLRNMKLNIRGV